MTIALRSNSSVIGSIELLRLIMSLFFLTDNCSTESFVKTLDANGTVMCAAEEPSLTFDPQELAVQSTGTMCVPLEMYCAWKCSLEANCTNFNYREDIRRCELFVYTPSNCSSIQFCSHKQLKDLNGSCQQPQVNATGLTLRCSFPYTYNGQLLYNCTQNVTNAVDVGCFAENRVWIACPPSLKDYVAQPVTINLTIPTFASPTQVISVDNWIVVQQRIDSSTDFGRNWIDYRNGFGVYSSNYWMGLERMHQLTNSSQYKLRIEVYYPTLHQWRSAEYDSFAIDAETNKYTLHVSGYSGDAYNNLLMPTNPTKICNGMQFSTPDADNDKYTIDHCANRLTGGWWFNACSYVTLNGAFNMTNAGDNRFEYYVGAIKTPVVMSRMLMKQV